jgi:hypothetical protein
LQVAFLSKAISEHLQGPDDENIRIVGVFIRTSAAYVLAVLAILQAGCVIEHMLLAMHDTCREWRSYFVVSYLMG